MSTQSHYLIVLISALVILAIDLYNLESLGLIRLWRQGFGTIDPNEVFTTSKVAGEGGGILNDVTLMTLPQLMLSTPYFLYNGMFTCMLAGREWNRIGIQPRTLCVSTPRFHQRSTYWLSLPRRFSMPLVAFSSRLHWLGFRSLSLVRILVVDHQNQREPA